MEIATEHRAYSMLSIKAVDDEARTITGVASTPAADRMGDIVDPKGAQFKLPLPLLWMHDPRAPIGNVTRAKVTKDGIEITAQIVKGISEEIDRAWSMIKSGLVRGLSIGFRELASEPIPQSWGKTFTKWEWLELSAVTIPANSEATITTIKAFADGMRAAPGPEQTVAEVLPGATGKSTKPVNLRPKDAITMSKTIQEQIAALEAKRAATAVRMEAIMQKAADDGLTTDASQQEEFDNLEAELAPLDADLKRYRTLEKNQVATAAPVSAVTTFREGSDNRATSPYRVPASVKVRHEPGTGLIRLMAAKWIAKEESRPAYDIARERFGDTPEIEMILRAGYNAQNWVSKTAVTAGTTTDSAWAGPLVVVNNLANEFLEYLRPKTILGRIPNLRMVPFNISVPRQLTETTGYWVGQGENKPVSSATFDTVTLLFHKLAAIAVITEELARFSSPSAETAVRESLAAAIIYRMDRDLLDSSKAAVTGVNPASLTNGVTPTAATGATADAFRDDIRTMLGVYLQNNMSTRGVVLVMTEDQALALSMMVNTLGQLEFPNLSSDGGNVRGIPVITSQNVVSTGGSPTDGYPIIAIHAPSILVADDGGVSIDISREASLQMNDAPDSPETTSTISISLWQHNMLGIKAERFVTWVKGRAQAVQFISYAKYT